MPSQTTARDPQQYAFIRKLRKFLHFSSFMETGPPVLNEQPRDPLDFQAPSPLHSIYSSSSHATQGRSRTDRRKSSRRTLASSTNMSPSTTPISSRTSPPTRSPVHPGIVDVPLAQGLSVRSVVLSDFYGGPML
ncbi:hypothetical protein M405DRAFT_218528 [Rhizopogon salebrosus TDB-379]|nr:hypothetical protein M405DRAFT_218528 [Rhizopogon salebrosus TDB-379]